MADDDNDIKTSARIHDLLGGKKQPCANPQSPEINKSAEHDLPTTIESELAQCGGPVVGGRQAAAIAGNTG